MEEQTMNNSVNYERLAQFADQTDTTRQFALLYCQIWKEPPWNEDFWTPEDVLQTLSKKMQLPEAECFLAQNQGLIIGFTRGYSVNRQELAEIAGGEQLNFIMESTPRIFYIDELGVAPNGRCHGIGRALTMKLIKHAKTRGLNLVVLRTERLALPARAVYRHLGFTELDVKDSRHESRTYWLLNL
jgi:ribosomal protein S18 acetylase RimI-like enzyme